MKIRFLGVGGASCGADQYQSNLLIRGQAGRRLLIDCGGDIRFSLAEAGYGPGDIDSVYISHLHGDHIGGLEWLAFSCRFRQHPRRPALLSATSNFQRIWDQGLRAGLELVDGGRLSLSDYFALYPLTWGFLWDGILAEMIKMPHVLAGDSEHPSFGLILQQGTGPAAFITTDTRFAPEILLPIANRVELILHDCETSRIPSGVHAHYSELCGLPEAVKNKIWLYHHTPVPNLDPRADGFLGMAHKGQEFHLAAIKDFVQQPAITQEID